MPKDSLSVFESITENTEHLIKLINEFLDITHIEQGKTKFFFEQTDVTGMITKVVEQVRSQIKERPVSLIWKPTTKPLLVDVDKDKMRDIIFNLVDNAVKYTEKGTVQVKLSVEGEQVTFAVKDQSLGFEEIDRVNFFQKFYRGKNAKVTDTEGLGVGLYLASSIIKRFKGKISVQSEGENMGSTFTITMPRSR
jgi:signal transduction histidine kinase